MPEKKVAWVVLCLVTVTTACLLVMPPISAQDEHGGALGWERLTLAAIPAGERGQTLVRVSDGFIIFQQSGTSPGVTRCRVNQDQSIAAERVIGFDRPSKGTSLRLETGTSAAWDGERYVYILAGSSYSRDRYYAVRFDTDTHTWDNFTSTEVTLSDGRRAGAQGAGTSLAHVILDDGAYLYAVVGRARSQVTPVSRWQPTVLIRHKLDAPASAWEVVSTFGESFWPKHGAGHFCTDDGASLVVVDGFLYLITGSDCTDTPTKLFARFRLPFGPWHRLPPVVAAAGSNDGASLAWDGERYIYAVVGGHCETREDKRSHGREFLRFDLEIEEWKTLMDLPIPLGHYPGTRIAVVGEHLFVWQGTNSRCNQVPVYGKGSALYRIRLSDVREVPQGL